MTLAFIDIIVGSTLGTSSLNGEVIFGLTMIQSRYIVM